MQLINTLCCGNMPCYYNTLHCLPWPYICECEILDKQITSTVITHGLTRAMVGTTLDTTSSRLRPLRNGWKAFILSADSVHVLCTMQDKDLGLNLQQQNTTISITYRHNKLSVFKPQKKWWNLHAWIKILLSPQTGNMSAICERHVSYIPAWS